MPNPDIKKSILEELAGKAAEASNEAQRKIYFKAMNSRDTILKLLTPFFPESQEAGVYFSPELDAYMLVAGNEITITFN